jgi:predicted outer membrane protein
MTKQHWARGAWAVVAIMATGVASAALPQQTSSDPATGQAPGINQGQENWNQQRTRGMTGRGKLDHFLVKVVIQANQDEISTARLAELRSSNQDVKKFAMQMVEDHTRLMNRLQQFKGGQHNGPMRGARQPADNLNNNGANSSPNFRSPTANGSTTSNPQIQGGTASNPSPANPNAVAQDQSGQDGALNQQGGRRTRGQTADQAKMDGRHDAAHQFVAIMEEVAKRTQQSMQRELSQKEGAEFDRAYLGGQIMAHMWLSDALSVFEQHASANLQPILQEGLQTAQQHLAHAKALLARIEQGQTKSTADRQTGGSGAR